MKREYISRSLQETESIGNEIAALLPGDAVVHLIGDLGVGKTTLARAVATALGADPAEVTSPSFAIVHEYPRLGKSAVIHIDGYRLSDHPHEWLEIGIPEILRDPGMKLIEWPKTGFARFSDQPIEIELTLNADESRTIVFRSGE